MGEVGCRGRAVDAVYNHLWSGTWVRGEASWLRGLNCAFVDLESSQ